jgi:hypothetical protein
MGETAVRRIGTGRIVEEFRLQSRNACFDRKTAENGLKPAEKRRFGA